MSISAEHLRPLKAGEILDRAFRLYRANFLSFIGVCAVLLLPLLGVEILFQVYLGTATFLRAINMFVIANFVNGAMIVAVSYAYLGRPISIWDSYWQALGHFGSLLLANFRLFGIYFFGIVIFLVSFLLDLLTSSNWAFQFVFPIVLPLFSIGNIIFWMVRWGLVMPIVLIEKSGAKDASDRSWYLTSKYFWLTCIVVVTSAILSLQIIFLPETILAYIQLRFFGISHIPSELMALVLRQLGYITSIPLGISALVILYYDLRVRDEGYDLELALQLPDEEDLLLESD